jgi:hypothetical protein
MQAMLVDLTLGLSWTCKMQPDVGYVHEASGPTAPCCFRSVCSFENCEDPDAVLPDTGNSCMPVGGTASMASNVLKIEAVIFDINFPGALVCWLAVGPRWHVDT